MINSDREKRIRFYFDTMALNDQLMQWYRAFFLAFEGIILTVVFTNLGSPWLRFGLALIGIGLSLAGTWACVQRGRIVDRQKKRITDELYYEDGTKKNLTDDLAECFEIYNPVKGKPEKEVPRTVFNYGLHTLIGVLLIYVVWQPCLSGNWYAYLGLPISYAMYAMLLIIVIDYLSWRGIPEDYRKTRRTVKDKLSATIRKVRGK